MTASALRTGSQGSECRRGATARESAAVMIAATTIREHQYDIRHHGLHLCGWKGRELVM
jgi:hypothetical protein